MSTARGLKLSKSMKEVLSDMRDGRVISQAIGDWGGRLEPRDIPGKKCRTFLGNVKTITIKALLKRELIRQRDKLSYYALYHDRIPRIFVLVEESR